MSQSIEQISQDVRGLREEFHRMMGTRLTREQLAERLSVSTRTLYNRIEGGSVPRPGPDGRWLLSDVMEWERS